MIAFTACLAGALYSAAYMWPKPWCYIALVLSTILVAWMRHSL